MVDLASMRPRFANRGSREQIVVRVVLLIASMRPRFANRGSEIVLDDVPIGKLASMRPRFANRGSSRGRSYVARAVRRFNEAPIRESGKFQKPTQIRNADIWLQ